MTLHIPLTQETEAKLRQRAAEAGKDLTSLVLEAVEELAGVANGSTQQNGKLSVEEWLKEWHTWAASHRTLDYVVDDSRESIYAGRGE